MSGPCGTSAFSNNRGHSAFVTMANHSSPRTTKLYDQRQDEISLDEVERISI
jgi:hypothetical protein